MHCDNVFTITGHFVGLAGSGAAMGIGNGAFELNVKRILYYSLNVSWFNAFVRFHYRPCSFWFCLPTCLFQCTWQVACIQCPNICAKGLVGNALESTSRSSLFCFTFSRKYRLTGKLSLLRNSLLLNIQADLFSGAIFIKQAMNLDGETGLYLSILILLAIAALFTITGGLTAVIWTDFVQTIIMLIGAFILMGMCKFYTVQLDLQYINFSFYSFQ